MLSDIIETNLWLAAIPIILFIIMYVYYDGGPKA